MVPAGDVDAMASRIARLLADPALRRRMGEAGRARIEARHSMPEMVRAYSALYEDMCAGRRGRRTGEPDARAAMAMPRC